MIETATVDTKVKSTWDFRMNTYAAVVVPQEDSQPNLEYCSIISIW